MSEGERESSFSVAGYVPSVNKVCCIRNGQEQVQAIRVALEKAGKKGWLTRKNKYLCLKVCVETSMEEKLIPLYD